MDNKIRTLASSAILMLIVSACSLTGNNPNNPVIADPPLVPAVELTVQADTAAPINTVGQNIAYTYMIKNTGNVPIPGVVSIDGAAVNCPAVNTIGNLDEFLDVGEVLTCVSIYTTTQADLDNGSIITVTTANVNGTLSAPVTTTVSTVPNRILTLTKTAAPQTYEQAGESITYTYVITNSGTLDIGPAQFTVNDLGFSAPTNCGNPDTTLAPNATVTCSATYTIAQADMNVESISSSATASGGGVTSEPVSATVTKSGLVQNPANLPVGSTIQHKVVAGEWLWQIARCYGSDPKKTIQENSQLPNPAQISPGMVVTVPNIGTAGNIYGPPCVGTHTVQSGETWNSIALKYNADPIVLQKVNLNSMPVGSVIKVPLNSAGGNTSVTRAVTLTVAVNPLTYDQVDQLITYTYTVKNSGNITLGPAQFTINSNLYAGALISCGNADTTLAPEATITCNSTYTINQADMTAASVTNIATASGGGAGPSASVSTTISKSVVASLSLVTSASPLTFTQAGQEITYTYVIKNTGSTTIGPAQFTISGSLFGTTPINCGAADTTLAPQGLITCTAIYTTTEADVTAIFVTNNATASGGGAGPSDVSSITINKE